MSTGAQDGVTDDVVKRLIDKSAIEDVLLRRARAGDRRDPALALSCYHEGATEEHEGFTGPAAEFLTTRSIIAPTSSTPVTLLWHMLGSIKIELDGNDAAVESYHVAIVELDDTERGPVRCTIGGRYLDRFAHRASKWAIDHRVVVFDWSGVEPSGTTYWEVADLDKSRIRFGAFGPDDPLYSVLGVQRGG